MGADGGSVTKFLLSYKVTVDQWVMFKANGIIVIFYSIYYYICNKYLICDNLGYFMSGL
jgi:hypothetical protein